ncbi:MAG: DUF1330 domain-containing protein [Paracoccaceae bacterium]
MPKGYWIVQIDLTDREAFQAYGKAVPDALARYGGRYNVRAGAQEVVEGRMRARSVVIEFPDLAAARACYESPEYQAIRPLREAASTSDICIVEGI